MLTHKDVFECVSEQTPIIPTLEEYWYDKLTPVQLGNDARALERKSIYKYPLLDNLSIYASNQKKLDELTNRIKGITEQLQERNFELYIRKGKVGISKDEEECFKNIEDYFAVYSAHIYWMAGEGGAIWPYDLDAGEQSTQGKDVVSEQATFSNSILCDNLHVNSASNDNNDFSRVDVDATEMQDAEDNAYSLEIQAVEASQDCDKIKELENVIEEEGAHPIVQELINQGSSWISSKFYYFSFPFNNLSCIELKLVNDHLHCAITHFAYIHGFKSVILSCDLAPDPLELRGVQYNMFKSVLDLDFAINEFQGDYMVPYQHFVPNVEHFELFNEFVDFVGCEKHLSHSKSYSNLLTTYAVKHNPSDPNSFHGFKYFDSCGVFGIGHIILIDLLQASYLRGFTHASQIPYSSDNLLIEPKQVFKGKRLRFLQIFLSSYKPP